MTSCLGFVFFDRRRSKERGQYFRKFLGKIDEIQIWTIFAADYQKRSSNLHRFHIPYRYHLQQHLFWVIFFNILAHSRTHFSKKTHYGGSTQNDPLFIAVRLSTPYRISGYFFFCSFKALSRTFEASRAENMRFWGYTWIAKMIYSIISLSLIENKCCCRWVIRWEIDKGKLIDRF